MKPDIHPEYNEITVIQTDGSKFKTRSTYSKSDTLRLDIDPLNHQAWTGKSSKLKETGRLAKFKDRYGDLGASKKEIKKRSEAAKEAAQKEQERKDREAAEAAKEAARAAAGEAEEETAEEAAAQEEPAAEAGAEEAAGESEGESKE